LVPGSRRPGTVGFWRGSQLLEEGPPTQQGVICNKYPVGAQADGRAADVLACVRKRGCVPRAGTLGGCSDGLERVAVNRAGRRRILDEDSEMTGAGARGGQSGARITVEICGWRRIAGHHSRPQREASGTVWLQNAWLHWADSSHEWARLSAKPSLLSSSPGLFLSACGFLQDSLLVNGRARMAEGRRDEILNGDLDYENGENPSSGVGYLIDIKTQHCLNRSCRRFPATQGK